VICSRCGIFFGKSSKTPEYLEIMEVKTNLQYSKLRVAVHSPNNLYGSFVLLSMSQQLPIPEPLWNTIPADAQAALLAAWKMMEDRIAELEAVVRDLQARL
jgi:hypothetical protein